jgi:hypothetical protein
MSDQVGVSMVGDDGGQHVDEAKLLVDPGQQQNAAIGTDLAAVECGCHLLPVYTWQCERQKGIVVSGGHGRFCPGIEDGVTATSLLDSRSLYECNC